MSTAPKSKTAPAMVSGFGKLHTNSESARYRRAYVPITWTEIQRMVDAPTSVAKSDARWFIPSTLQDREGKAQEARGEFWALWADFDGLEATAVAPPSITTVNDMLDMLILGPDVNREQHSSGSATAVWQKSHLYIPLAKPLRGADWVICQTVLHDALIGCELDPDPKVLGPSQICYLPNKGLFYETLSKRDGVMFDPLKEWAQQIAAKRTALAQAKRLQDERREEARKHREAMREARSTCGTTLVDAFNQAYTPAEFMLAAGYDERGDTFRHPASQSGSYSASIKEGRDGVLRVHTLSSSDPLYSNGQGAHDAFSTFTVLNHGGIVSEATKDAGDNWLKIGTESWNKVQQREYMRDKAKSAADAAFGDVSGDEEEIDPETGEVKKKIHPLAKFVDCGAEPMTPDWVIPGLIAEGIVTISGSAGVGKTTVLLPLAMTAAGLHEWSYELAPEPDRWRHCIYIVEDLAQAQRIQAGMMGSQDMGLNADHVRERFHLVEAQRMDAAEAVKVGKLYREKWGRIVDGVEIKPLVVIDTRSATLAVDNENDNAEASRVVGALKQRFEGLPVWLVGHLAKGIVNRSNVGELSSRGAGAIEADANQNMYIVKEGDADDAPRYLVRGKTRFEARWSELAIQSHTTDAMGVDRWGKKSPIVLRWAIASPGLRTRAQAKAGAQEAARAEADAELRGEILEAVTVAWLNKEPLNKAAVRGLVKRGTATVVSTIEALLSTHHLYEVQVPINERAIRTRGSFLVSLNDEERAELTDSGVLPDAKLEIPPSWKKPGQKQPVDDVLSGEPSTIESGGKK